MIGKSGGAHWHDDGRELSHAVMSATRLLSVALGLVLVIPSAGWATEGGRPVCVAEGKSYDPGSVACIPSSDGGKRLARCDLMGEDGGHYVRWTILADSCPLARAQLDPLRRLLGHPIGAFTPTPASFGP